MSAKKIEEKTALNTQQRGSRRVVDLAVDDIKDPKQRALARQVPHLCAVFGVEQARLTVRDQVNHPRAKAQSSMREFALGSVAWLGRELGIPWTDLHGYAKESGNTEIAELWTAKRWSLNIFATRFGALTGLGDDPETGTVNAPPVGEVGQLARVRYLMIREDAYRDLQASQARAHAAAAVEPRATSKRGREQT